MLSGGMFPRFASYGVLALGFWLLFQGFERGHTLLGILGGALIILGMYLMTGVWRNMFARFGGPPKARKENRLADETPNDHTEESTDSTNGDTPQ